MGSSSLCWFMPVISSSRFFLSGLGLSFSYLKKGKVYLHGFWRNRILYLLFIYVFFSVLYLAYFRLIGHSEIGLKNLFISFVNGKPIAMNSWYIIVQIVMYLFFYLAYSIPNIQAWTRISIVFLLVLLLSIGYRLLGYSSIWYISNFAFVFGLVVGHYKRYVDAILSQHWILCLFVSLVAFTLFSALPLILEHFHCGGDNSRIVARMVSSVSFVAIVLSFLYKVSLTRIPWLFIGSLSLEIYLIQGMVYSFLRSDLLYVHSNSLWILLTIIITVIVSIPLHQFALMSSSFLRKS